MLSGRRAFGGWTLPRAGTAHKRGLSFEDEGLPEADFRFTATRAWRLLCCRQSGGLRWWRVCVVGVWGCFSGRASHCGLYGREMVKGIVLLLVLLLCGSAGLAQIEDHVDVSDALASAHSLLFSPGRSEAALNRASSLVSSAVSTLSEKVPSVLVPCFSLLFT